MIHSKDEQTPECESILDEKEIKKRIVAVLQAEFSSISKKIKINVKSLPASRF